MKNNPKNKKRLSLIIATLLLSGLLVYVLFYYPQLKWDKSGETQIVYTSPGMVEINFGYIRDVQIWGDGKIVWVDILPNGRRRVYQGTLNEQQIIDILQSIKESGMFNLIKPSRDNNNACTYIGNDNELHVKLLRARRHVLIWQSEEQFCDLVNFLASGADLEGIIFEPTLGIVYPIPLESKDGHSKEEWSPSSLPFDFNEAIKARGRFEIDGQALDFVWDFVNKYPDPIVTYQGNKYRIGLSVPEVSP
jgi:hypothetical protein